ncbi:MAG: ABC transporter ATP-binding protein/permease [Candidatus Pacebacteria bacterium]|nr:ABC transporter ATP-binding protein/permease [Candidatus Paceibacterota bacterium]MCF7863092.1 ABC transporter ATP-binding protein/permease [Candidatus Paceibacterota bacterium]
MIAVFLFYFIGIVLSSILMPLVYQNIIDFFSIGDRTYFQDIRKAFYFLVLIVVIFQTCYRLGDFLMTYFQSKVLRDLNYYVFDKILNHSYSFFANNFAGSLVAKVKRFSFSFETISDIIGFNIFFSIVKLTGILIVLYYKVPTVALVFLIWSIVYILITFSFIRRFIKHDHIEAEADSSVTGRLADVIGNVLNVKIFSSKKGELKDFRELVTDAFDKKLRAWNFHNIQNAIQGFMLVTLNLFVVYFLITNWDKGFVTPGIALMVLIYMTGIFEDLWGLGRSFVRLFKAFANATEMVKILDQKPDIEDDPNPEVCNISKGEIVFKDVHFSYVSGQDVFKSFNLTIQPGEKVGLVGHSGSGKSTILKILLRFANLTSGQILIDGQDISRLRQDDLRNKISYVPQEPILFHRSILENIKYSRIEVTDEEIKEASKNAHAHEFIVGLPNGYDTLVGERGIKLSEGEKQRVAIARAILKESPILILDEATSSLDSISEYYIQDAFSRLMKGKTTIVVAHRLSTIEKMDRIIVLDKGAIVEEGTHKELVAKNGFYAELWKRQTGGFLAE